MNFGLASSTLNSWVMAPLQPPKLLPTPHGVDARTLDRCTAPNNNAANGVTGGLSCARLSSASV
jgi:hypothetical protein